jgi:hypothetical protein
MEVMMNSIMPDLQFLESVIKMPLMRLPVRSTVVTVKDGRVLISPGSKVSREELANLGTVTDIVAPNLFHCAGVPKAAEVFNSAKLWVAEGGRDAKVKIKWSGELNETQWPYQEELPVLQLKGMPLLSEYLFFHKKSRTLIVADLCFNMVNQSGLGSWLILSLFGTYNQFGVSKFFLKFVKDKLAFEKSLGHVFAWNFDNIVVGHGANINGGGRELLLRALKKRGFEPK